MSNALPSPRLAELRAAVHALERGAGSGGRGPALAFGCAEIDDRLADRGIASGALHEAAAADPGLAASAATALFLAGIAARFDGVVLWALGRRDLFAPGLEQGGLPPSRLIYAEAGNQADILFVMEEGLRHGGLAAVVGEVGRIGMAATRRLQLAAEIGGTPALLLRVARRPGEDPLAEPSAAMTRWRIAPHPSAPLPVPGVGRARWRLSLVRQRGGAPFDWIVEANDAAGRIAYPAAACDRAAAPDTSHHRVAA